MALVIPDQSKQTVLRYITNHLPQENLVIHLYVNNVTPTVSSVKTDFVEMTQGNYSSAELLGNNWEFTMSAPVEATYPDVTWVFSGAIGTVVYGYFITGSTSNRMVWAERFPFDYTINADGDALRVTPKLRLDD